ncbi:tyrosine-type recombinase/integrase [Sinorhizobium meliloti]|nr:tyrosine-type recombinase/integrase [Sinorhizobium meliloti]MDX0252296.1 tyrosine-type recombinase/integrase [Sinorhizobium meliloti]
MNHINLQAAPRQWLESSLLGAFSKRYVEHLDRARYAPGTARVYLCCIGHFARWISTERLALASIDEAARARFISEHLPVCDCPYPARHLPHELTAAITHLLAMLRTEAAIPLATVDTKHDGELAAFRAHMRDVGGLAVSTRARRERILQRFLQEQFPEGEISIAGLEPAHVRRFILGELQGWTTATIRIVGGSISCYLRFRQMMGDDVQHLLGAIPRVACWRLSSLPDVLSDAQIETLLASFDKDFPSRRRAYAMVRCLTDLGLRTSEVAQLQLGDIDWRQGTIRISRSKGRRFDVLPLPPETGDAIAAYLRHERPPSTNRAIFVRHVAPYDLPIQKDVVRRAVFAAYKRCGWSQTRVHILRHSVASRMLNAGVPMKQIADILRHRSIDTSMIYTKVDLQRLAAVAMPWPGSVA